MESVYRYFVIGGECSYWLEVGTPINVNGRDMVQFQDRIVMNDGFHCDEANAREAAANEIERLADAMREKAAKLRSGHVR